MAASSSASAPNGPANDREIALCLLAWEQGYKAGWSKPDQWAENPYGMVQQPEGNKAKKSKAKNSKAVLKDLNQQRFDYVSRQRRGYQVFLGTSGWLWYAEEDQVRIAAIRYQVGARGSFAIGDSDWMVQIEQPTARMWEDIEHPEDMLVSQCVGWQYNENSQTRRAIRQLVDDELNL